MELAQYHGLLEFGVKCLFLDWNGEDSATACAQSSHHVHSRQSMFRPESLVWLWKHWTLGAALYSFQVSVSSRNAMRYHAVPKCTEKLLVTDLCYSHLACLSRSLPFSYTSTSYPQRTGRHFLYCNSQEASYLSSLVSSHYCAPLLLAFLRDNVSSGHFLCRYELLGACQHVWLLLSHGHAVASKVVQANHYYCLSNFANGCGRRRHLGWFLLLFNRSNVQD